MSYRKDVNPKSDMKYFTNTAKRHRDINLRPLSMRGGIRL